MSSEPHACPIHAEEESEPQTVAVRIVSRACGCRTRSKYTQTETRAKSRRRNCARKLLTVRLSDSRGRRERTADRSSTDRQADVR
ncbi:MAG: hypothetical protein ACI4NG_01845, partial [Candidatus Gallimonas sp.]